MKKKVIILSVIFLVLVSSLFLYSHFTPERAIRTSIFSRGDFSRAFSCKIVSLNSTEGKMIYKISPHYYEESTNTIFDEYEVTKTRLNYYVAGFYFNN